MYSSFKSSVWVLQQIYTNTHCDSRSSLSPWALHCSAVPSQCVLLVIQMTTPLQSTLSPSSPSPCPSLWSRPAWPWAVLDRWGKHPCPPPDTGRFGRGSWRGRRRSGVWGQGRDRINIHRQWQLERHLLEGPPSTPKRERRGKKETFPIVFKLWVKTKIRIKIVQQQQKILFTISELVNFISAFNILLLLNILKSWVK